MSRILVSYFIASILYLLASPCLGTPFKDSLSENQKRIKKESSKVRGRVFFSGLLIGAVASVWLPFRLVKSV